MRTKRLLLRKWNRDDAPALYALAKDPEVGPAAGWPVHRDVEDSRRIIREVLSDAETYAIVLEATGQIVGSIGLSFGPAACSEQDGEPELGYWIGKPFWGNGYAPEAGARLIDHAFQDLGCAAVWCCHYAGNEKSRRVMEKLGFRYVRTNPCGDTLLGYTLPEIEMVRYAREDTNRGGV